jgi:hypothetical protein
MIARARGIQLELDPIEGEHVLRTLEAMQEIYLQKRDELKEARRRLAN